MQDIQKLYHFLMLDIQVGVCKQVIALYFNSSERKSVTTNILVVTDFFSEELKYIP
jgi:hypothetical protein